jgi:hypothetical protein
VTCPVGAITADRSADPVFRLDNRRFFEETLSGRAGPLGSPGGAGRLGVIAADTPMVASYAMT